MPVYNAEHTIVKAIQSVQGQTYQDWELVIVDDYSMDNTLHKVIDFVGYDKRIKWHSRLANSGSPVVPRNQGVKYARGKYLCFLDADDYWFKDKLEVQLGFMQYTGGVMSFHDLKVYFLDEQQQPVREERWSKTAAPYDGYVFEVLLRKNFIPTSSVMVDRRQWFIYGGMDAKYQVSHDWDLWLKIAMNQNIYYLNEVLGVLLRQEGTIIGDVHKRRRECRQIIYKYLDYVDGMWYRKITIYYYLMEIFDVLPLSWQQWIRSKWYEQERFK